MSRYAGPMFRIKVEASPEEIAAWFSDHFEDTAEPWWCIDEVVPPGFTAHGALKQRHWVYIVPDRVTEAVFFKLAFAERLL